MRLRNSCPYCRGDIHGSPRKGYYCAQCNVLHTRRELALRHIRHELRDIIDDHFAAYSTEETTDDIEEIRRAMSEIAELLRNPHAFDVAPPRRPGVEHCEDALKQPRPSTPWQAATRQKRSAKPAAGRSAHSKRVTGKKQKPKSGKRREAHKTTKRKTAKRTIAKPPVRRPRRQK